MDFLVVATPFLGGQCLYHKKGTAEEVAASDLEAAILAGQEMIGKGSRKAVVYHDTVGEMLYWGCAVAYTWWDGRQFKVWRRDQTPPRKKRA